MVPFRFNLVTSDDENPKRNIMGNPNDRTALLKDPVSLRCAKVLLCV